MGGGGLINGREGGGVGVGLKTEGRGGGGGLINGRERGVDGGGLIKEDK